MKSVPKAGFLKPEKLRNHSNEGKGKEEKKKAVVALFAFVIATVELQFLAITLSKTRLASGGGAAGSPIQSFSCDVLQNWLDLQAVQLPDTSDTLVHYGVE